MSNTNLPSQLERVEEYFGASAHEWQELYARPQRVNDFVLANRRRLAVKSVEEYAPRGARVLDAGCGAGLIALDLVEHGFFVQGVDISENMLELAEQRFRAAHIATDRYALERADVSQADLAPASFGAVVALGFLEYQTDEPTTLRRLHELLKPGGLLVVSGPTERRLANYWGASTFLRQKLEHAGVLDARPGPVRVGLHRYGPDRFRSLLEAASFRVIDVQGHGFVEFEGPLRHLPYQAELALHRAFSWVSKYLPIQRWGNDTIAVARKA